jgi:hypothetical protein
MMHCGLWPVVLIKKIARRRHDQNGQLVSALLRITDSTRTSSYVRKVRPKAAVSGSNRRFLLSPKKADVCVCPT